jgi:hypothetical protein
VRLKIDGVKGLQMADPAKSQEMPAVKEDAYHIPSRAEHQLTVRRIWRTCGITGASVCLFMLGTVVAMKMMHYEAKDIVSVQLILVYIFVPVYGLGFVAAALATSLLKMGLAVDMSREGLDIGQKTAEVAEKIDSALDSRLARVDGTLDSLDRMVKEFERGEGPLLKVFRDEMKKLRAEIRGSRQSTEEELAEALDEGEAAAAAPSCDTCGTRMTPITHDEAPTGAYACAKCVPAR